ncbi:MAG: leucine-rich repeat-containing protein kinase family protein [Limnohabitans sp.]
MSAHTLKQLRSGQLKGVRELKLACGLSEFPREILDLADTLEVLDLSGNALSALPDDFALLKKLRIFFASDNAFITVPEVLGQCPALAMVGFKANRIHHLSGQALPAPLRWLILTDNALTALPAEIGRCTQLQKLMLAGNQLSALPAELAACQKLELLRISANRLTQLPDWLLRMPRLAWLACGGNPFCEAAERHARQRLPIDHIAWSDMQIQQPLGAGASGVIYQALLRTEQGPRPVAVKLFKAAVTSDGWPHTEMAVCLHAGAHAQLIPALGPITGHPTATQGLVMPLIEPVMRNLAGPPSLASCTRDIYAPSTRFTLDTALQLAQGIARAVHHLHRQGILHGDLYAHNILHDGQGQALLGDFGAGWLLTSTDLSTAQALQQLEVRAFGCLLEELLDRCDDLNTEHALTAQLQDLKHQCLRETPSERPRFEAIEHAITALCAR